MHAADTAKYIAQFPKQNARKARDGKINVELVPNLPQPPLHHPGELPPSRAALEALREITWAPGHHPSALVVGVGAPPSLLCYRRYYRIVWAA
eukprot:1627684-Pyramimonas_sp.AAC.1